MVGELLSRRGPQSCATARMEALTLPGGGDGRDGGRLLSQLGEENFLRVCRG